MKLAGYILLTAFLGMGAYFACRAFFAPPASEKAAAPEAPATPEPEVAVVPAPPPRRALAITGWVYRDLAPAAGAAVVLGEETATAGPDGSFAFPAAVRDRAVRVAVRGADGAASEWDDVLAGDPQEEEREREGDGSAAYGSASAAAILPARPEHIRWTFNLTLRAEEHEWIRARDAVVEEWGSGARVRARADTRFPDGARITSSLYFDGLRFIASFEPAAAREGAVTAVLMAPPDVKVFSGDYEIQLTFDTVLQDRERVLEWNASRPEVGWEALEVPEAKARVFLGSAREAREEDLAARDYYGTALEEARLLRRSLRSRVDAALLAGKGWDPAILDARRRAREGWFEDPLVDATGRLLEDKWRRFLAGWRGRLQALRGTHAARGAEKYLEAARMMNTLLTAMLEESYALSRFSLYPLFGLVPHPDDEYAEEYLGDLRRLDSLIEGNAQALDRYAHLGSG